MAALLPTISLIVSRRHYTPMQSCTTRKTKIYFYYTSTAHENIKTFRSENKTIRKKFINYFFITNRNLIIQIPFSKPAF